MYVYVYIYIYVCIYVYVYMWSHMYSAQFACVISPIHRAYEYRVAMHTSTKEPLNIGLVCGK